MDVQQRINKVKSLQTLKEHAMNMADQGAGALEVRHFVNEGAKRIAYEHPDEEAFHNAARATLAYKRQKEQSATF